MKIGIPQEIARGERRVAAVPETVAKMVAAGMEVCVETGAGNRSFISDEAYVKAGAQLEQDHKALFDQVDVILKVQRPMLDKRTNLSEVDYLSSSVTLIAPLYPFRHTELITQLATKKVTAFSLDLLPRIARAQSMDILSSMSNLAGYKSVIVAADHLAKIFPMMTTAAGTMQPAKVIVIGAGVAGLQAIATARRLGAVVLGFDTRPAAGEQVKSLGADFVSLETTHETAEDASGYAKEQSAEFYKNEQAIIEKYLPEADVIITTALIPGKPAPILITEKMVKKMRPGSVIVDLAVEQGGNCQLAEAGKTLTQYDVTIIGLLNVPSLIPINASQLYAKNIYTFLNYIADQLNKKDLDLNDEIIKNCLVTYRGEVVHPALRQKINKKDDAYAK